MHGTSLTNTNNTGQSNGYSYVKCSAVFNEEKLLEMKHRLQIECNSLQDKLDAYNALHKIEFDTPLTD